MEEEIEQLMGRAFADATRLSSPPKIPLLAESGEFAFSVLGNTPSGGDSLSAEASSRPATVTMIEDAATPASALIRFCRKDVRDLSFKPIIPPPQASDSGGRRCLPPIYRRQHACPPHVDDFSVVVRCSYAASYAGVDVAASSGPPAGGRLHDTRPEGTCRSSTWHG